MGSSLIRLGLPFLPMAFIKKRNVGFLSRLAVSRKSIVSPYLSTARYKCFHCSMHKPGTSAHFEESCLSGNAGLTRMLTPYSSFLNSAMVPSQLRFRQNQRSAITYGLLQLSAPYRYASCSGPDDPSETYCL